MAERIFFIVVVCFFVFNKAGYSQDKSGEVFSRFVPEPLSYQSTTNSKSFANKYKNMVLKINSKTDFSAKKNTQNFFSLASDFYSKHTGFFCQQELKFQKITAIPLRFRLGSVAYTDYLERKPNALRY